MTQTGEVMQFQDPGGQDVFLGQAGKCLIQCQQAIVRLWGECVDQVGLALSLGLSRGQTQASEGDILIP